MLFLGDAQVGNWLSGNNLPWSIKDSGVKTRKVKIDDLIVQRFFYEFGHHGSHNAALMAKVLDKIQGTNFVCQKICIRYIFTLKSFGKFMNNSNLGGDYDKNHFICCFISNDDC